MQETTQRITALERDLFCVASTGAFIHTFCGLAGRLHDLLHLLHRACSGKLFLDLNLWLARECLPDDFILYFESLEQCSFDPSTMSFFRRSLTMWSSRFASGDFISNPVTAGLGMLEIGACQLKDQRLHEPPDFLPFCQP